MEILHTKRLDNLGIVMGTMKEFGIIDLIDEKLGKDDQQNISTGEAVAAMVMNGLGFAGRPLSLTPNFYETKALDVLFSREVDAEEFNRHRLGRALDAVHAYGCELLYTEIASKICKILSIDTKFTSLDTTSFSVSGEYDVDSDENTITITHGYSKDHRPDLKQAVLELVTSQDGGLPLMMKCFSGNASDNKIFKERCKELTTCFKNSKGPRYLVGDSKLYHRDNASNLAEMKFITRIPRTYKEENRAITEAIETNQWEYIDEENRYYVDNSKHFDITQRWIVVHSTSAKSRAESTLNKQIEKEYRSASSALLHLRNKEFNCEQDAKKELERVSSQFKYHEILLEKIVAHERYSKAGRPKKTDVPVKEVYQVRAGLMSLYLERDERLSQRCCYIIGTNTDENELEVKDVIEAYKNQNASVERGFRFLKDPQFFTSSFFVKKPSRIMALLMIMTLALLVYSLAQKQLREQLIEKNETLPNQINQPVKNPTMRWVFQIMEGVDVVYIQDRGVKKRKIMGLNELRRKVISFLFDPVQEIYGTANLGESVR